MVSDLEVESRPCEERPQVYYDAMVEMVPQGRLARGRQRNRARKVSAGRKDSALMLGLYVFAGGLTRGQTKSESRLYLA